MSQLIGKGDSGRTDRFEELVMAISLGLMTLFTFANVVARRGFNSNIFYALELTVFLFAWLVLLGTSYAVHKNMQLGVDFFVNMATKRRRKVMALFSVAICILYSLFLLKGAWDYWAPYANLPPTDGRWFPLGFIENYRGQGWYETQDIPVPFFLSWIKHVFNDGEAYEKLPKVIPYFVLPLSTLLLFIRFVQTGINVWRGRLDRLIISHEAEDDLAEAAAKLNEQA